MACLSCSSHVTLFRCISLWVYHGILPFPFFQLSPPTRFLLIIAIGMCHFLPVHHFGMACLAGLKVNIQYTYLHINHGLYPAIILSLFSYSDPDDITLVFCSLPKVRWNFLGIFFQNNTNCSCVHRPFFPQLFSTARRSITFLFFNDQRVYFIYPFIHIYFSLKLDSNPSPEFSRSHDETRFGTRTS